MMIKSPHDLLLGVPGTFKPWIGQLFATNSARQDVQCGKLTPNSWRLEGDLANEKSKRLCLQPSQGGRCTTHQGL